MWLARLALPASKGRAAPVRVAVKSNDSGDADAQVRTAYVGGFINSSNFTRSLLNSKSTTAGVEEMRIGRLLAELDEFLNRPTCLLEAFPCEPDVHDCWGT